MLKLKDIPLKQWIKAIIATLFYVLFIVWVGNYWWLLLLPLILDVYLTKFVPWTFWKKTKNKFLIFQYRWSRKVSLKPLTHLCFGSPNIVETKKKPVQEV